MGREIIDILLERAARALGKQKEAFYPGHYYSTIPSKMQIQSHRDPEFTSDLKIPGIHIDFNEQIALFGKLAEFYDEQPFPEEMRSETRYYFNNGWFGHGDALILYSMIRHLRPRKIIEIGSGFSSCVMLV